MAYFPMFVDLADKKVLIVGGGRIAFHKFKRLLDFGPEITVVAKSFIHDFYIENSVKLIEGTFTENLLDDCDMVIAATDDRELNTYVSEKARARRIPVNSVDDKDNCSFIFPSFITDGRLSVGVSTSGSSPTMAAYLKNCIERSLPDNISEILDYLDSVRPYVKERLPQSRIKEFYSELIPVILTDEAEKEDLFDQLLHKYEGKRE